jgi:hypothetical protein
MRPEPGVRLALDLADQGRATVLTASVPDKVLWATNAPIPLHCCPSPDRGCLMLRVGEAVGIYEVRRRTWGPASRVEAP